MKKKYKITARLRKLRQATEADVFGAVVEHEDDLLMGDICQALALRNAAYPVSVLEKSVNLVLSAVLKEVLSGSVVDMGNFKVEMLVRGKFKATDTALDRQRHSLKLKIIPKKAIYKEFDKVEVDVKEAEKYCRIDWVTNERLGNIDGVCVAGDKIIVEGCGLVPAGKDNEVGVYLVDAERRGSPLPLSQGEFKSLSSERLDITISDKIPCGRYYIKVVTQYDAATDETVTKISRAISRMAVTIEGDGW
jgi:hypothetical protein